MNMANVPEKFNAEFEIICSELLQELQTAEYNIPEDARQWIERALRYSVPGGKLNRGLSVVESYVSLLRNKTLSPLEEKRCFVLGWCVEMMQAFFLIADDIMDQSKTRRGQKCYYLVDGVGNVAINDCLIIQSLIYKLLRQHFKTEPYYIDLVELMHEITYKTELGQLLDLITAPEDSIDLSKFSLEKHAWIVRYKTAYYSFYLPVAMAMLMAGHREEDLFKQAEGILIEMGEYFQIQDDYLDCYGDPAYIGKIGTDILDNKCSWLINRALKKCNSQQRKILDENYGRKSSECEMNVKQVYKELKLESDFFALEEERNTRINAMIAKVDDAKLPHVIFTKFMQRIHKRTK